MVPCLRHMGVMSRFILAVLASAMALGCDPTPPPDADAGDGGVTGGIELRWTAIGIDTPQSASDIDELHLELRDLQVVGDASPTTTHRDRATIELSSGGEPVTRFENAPPGRYSSIEFTLERPDDEEAAWALEGRVEIDGVRHPFEIEDDQSTTVSVALPGLSLSAGETAVVSVEVDAARLLDGIDWDAVPREEDEIHLTGDSPQVAVIRERLRVGFHVQ